MTATNHECAKHQPGRGCYSRCGCRCDTCRVAASNYQQRVLSGTTARVPGPIVLAHVDRLIKSGMTPEAVAAAASVPDATLGNLLAGRTHNVNRKTAAAILAVTISTPHRGMLDTAGTSRRLQALAAIGWDSGMLGRRAGVNPRRIEDIRSNKRPRVHASVAEWVAKLYDDLSMTPAIGWRADRARRTAAARGWVPPLAWDDGTGPHGIDNPAATPVVATGRRDVIGEIRHLANQGAGIQELMAQLGVTRSAIDKACRRAGDPELWQKITREAA